MTKEIAALARRLGPYDVALLVIGSVVGSGIFRTPAVVAQRIQIPGLIVVAWTIGGIVALFGVFVLGELGVRRPEGCGAYAYLRDAFHPVVAFAYGWTSLLASFTGGLAAAAVLFAGYFLSLTGLSVAPVLVAACALAVLAVVNSLGVRHGTNVQGALTALKVAALVGLVATAIAVHPGAHRQIQSASTLTSSLSKGAGNGGTLAALSIALVPILFTYNGAVVANFMAREARDVTRTLPLGLVWGMSGVVALYLLVNGACLRVLGAGGLAATPVPVSAVLQVAAGQTGARIAAFVVALTTLGFMSNRMLTVPRLYHAMADDGLFFRAVGRIDPRTHAPVAAIVLQGAVAIVIALSGGYEHILNYVVSTFYVFNGLLALALFVIRARDRSSGVRAAGRFRVPGHPVSTALYLFASWGVAIATCIAYPRDGLTGLAILLSAVPVYAVWARRATPANIAA